jgi:hypothetical protein
MGLFSRARKARDGGAAAERARAEEAYADVILACDALDVATRAPFMERAERLHADIKRVADGKDGYQRLVQIESELRLLAQRARRAAP